MPISDTSKIDLLWKKVAYGVAKTDSATAKSGSNETLASNLPTYAHQIWTQSAAIPAIPTISAAIPIELITGVASLCTVDATSALNVTWKSAYSDFVPPTFGVGYTVKVYVGNPSSGGVQIYPDTSGYEYFFDYQSGNLHFLNSPALNVGTNKVYVVGYRYTGTKGIPTSNASRNYVVTSIAARDALTGLVSGDTAFVTDASTDAINAGQGEYAMYMYVGGVWSLIATQDSAKEDADTYSVTVTPGSISSGWMMLSYIGNGARVVSCSIDVTTPFDGTMDLTVGLDSDVSSIMSINDHDVKSVGSYVVTPTKVFNINAESLVKVFATGTATVGQATVTITYA